MSASAPEIRAARSFLVQHQIQPGKVSPLKFANSAKELDVGFRELLRILGLLNDQGQGEQIARKQFLDNETRKITGVPVKDKPKVIERPA